MKSPEFEIGQIVYRFGRKANWAEVVGRGSYLNSPQPHYWIKRDGVVSLESITRLSANPMDDVLDRHKNRSRSKKRASDATTPEVAANPTEVTE